MIKLFLTDVDGTLFPEYGQELPDCFFDSLRELMDRGMLFGVCSGRPKGNLEKVFGPVTKDILFVCENGAYAAYRGENILLESIAAEDVAGVVRDVRRLDGCASMYDTGEICYFERGDEEGFEAMRDVYHFDCEMVEDLLVLKQPCIKFTIYRRDHIEAVLADAFMPKWTPKLSIACSGERVMDIMSKQVSKGTTIAAIQKCFGIAPEETLAVGDNLNDVEMLKQAAYSVAVANARDTVKAICRYETVSCTDDGELKIIQSLLADFDDPDRALMPYKKSN